MSLKTFPGYLLDATNLGDFSNRNLGICYYINASPDLAFDSIIFINIKATSGSNANAKWRKLH